MVQWGPEDVGSDGMRWTDLTPEEWRARDELAVADLKATGTMQPYQKEYFRRDGSRVPVLVGAALFEEDGNDGVAFALDLSEQKRAEEAFRRVEEQARAIVDSALDAVVAMDADGMIADWNRQAEETFGWTRSEALGRRMSETIIPIRYRLSHQSGLRQFFKTGQGAVLNRRIEITALRRDGTEFPVELTIAPLKSGDTWTFSAFVRDISGRKRAEEKLRESELNLRNTQAELAHMARVMTMGELTASIAHEVNQPLAAIIASGDSCSAWLSNDPPNLDKARAAASRIIQAATQASEIVQRLRALFKKTTSMTASVDMNAVIEDTLSLVQHETERNKIFLRTELHPGVSSVSGDRVQLQQVILNLAMNGIESIAGLDYEPKRLMIRSTLSNTRELLVSVEDTGLGIEVEHADRLFAPFFTTKPEGIGMGLPICRSIIEAHGGRLWADKNEPRGAAFHFALPVNAPSE
jgi:PAS domain S-box-containing protein